MPLLGTVVGRVAGGVLGSLTGGALAGYGSKRALDRFCPDDAQQMLEPLPPALSQLAFEHEVASLGHAVQQEVSPAFLRAMFAAPDREGFVHAAFGPRCLALAQDRTPISLGV